MSRDSESGGVYSDQESGKAQVRENYSGWVRWVLLSVLLATVLVGCDGHASPTLAAAAQALPEVTATLHQIPSRTPTATQTKEPTATPSPTPTPTPTATPTPSPDPTPTDPPALRQLRILDQLDRLVTDNYLYPDYNGLNWPAWIQVIREQIAAGMTDAALYQALTELVDKLNDGHSTFQPPAAARLTNAAIQGRQQTVGIGVATTLRPERRTIILLTVYPDSPAWHAGLRPHDSVISINGLPAIEAAGQLEGAANTTILLVVQTPGQAAREVEVARSWVTTPPPVVAHQVGGEEATGLRLIYVAIHTFWDEHTASLLRQRLLELGNEGAIDGLIIDLRTNRGGSEYTLKGALALFTDGTLGHFARRAGERPLAVSAAPVHNSQSVPLIVLVGHETSSYAEIFAGVLQSAGRARVVGTPTRGNVETIWPHDFEDGSRVWIAEEAFRPLTGDGWENQGITPDQIVPGDWGDFTAETDPQLAMAVELLTGR
jgi:carboxyl-terminal processing protease